MKKTFLARRNALLSSSSVSWGAVALAFAVLALLLRLLAPNLFLHIFAPAFRAAEAVSARSHSFLNGFRDVAALAAQNERLMRENDALASENRVLMERTAEADGLLGGIVAGVVARPPASPYDTLVVAGGARSGIATGMEAFGAGNVPLGVVSSVSTDFSRITLFSAPGAVTHGWVGSAHTPLTIFGEGAGAMRATLPRSALVAVGDVVFVPGPGLLPVGRVARIDSDPAEPGVVLRIASNANLFSIAWIELRDIGAALRDSFSLSTTTP